MLILWDLVQVIFECATREASSNLQWDFILSVHLIYLS